ncbi:hypothetical protein predicted by Glimmer/Critica [Sorangium cellulosum So ce56]|uniref:Uncharacterized protein n=1 Tax=Sorangium cellulosum (strain So ce56) TaxID=448385 RepID=A9F9J1_SORC5|nr:hypothetical protein predicted by Glimmer/Critica [Sorangium cellulosum So ce56]
MSRVARLMALRRLSPGWFAVKTARRASPRTSLYAEGGHRRRTTFELPGPAALRRSAPSAAAQPSAQSCVK